MAVAVREVATYALARFQTSPVRHVPSRKDRSRSSFVNRSRASRPFFENSTAYRSRGSDGSTGLRYAESSTATTVNGWEEGFWFPDLCAFGAAFRLVPLFGTLWCRGFSFVRNTPCNLGGVEADMACPSYHVRLCAAKACTAVPLSLSATSSTAKGLLK
jgi:hypothetical protein